MQSKKTTTNYKISLSEEQISTGNNILYTSAKMVLFLSNVLKPFNLTFQQYNVLRILRKTEMPLSVKGITVQMIDPSSNCSRLVDKLVSKSLVSRLESETDKRIVNVVLTESGIELADSAAAVISAQVKSKLDTFSDDDLKRLNNILDKLKTLLDN
jgi:DNA-binding MarR family transcriptional regulator